MRRSDRRQSENQREKHRDFFCLYLLELELEAYSC